MFRSFLAILFLVIASITVRAETIQMGISVDMVPVASDFNGTDIVIFGSIEGADKAALKRGEYDVVIKVEGVQEDVIVRRKERIAGIWINNKKHEYTSVPAFYSVLSSRPLSEIAETDVLRKEGIGIDNLGARPSVQGDLAFVLVAGEFSDALLRIRTRDELFAENGNSVEQLSPTLFRATLSLPPNVPIGEHNVTAYLFRDGEITASNSQSKFTVGKVGFERWIYNLAHNNSLIYGLMAVFVAIFTGWAANAIFRKN